VSRAHPPIVVLSASRNPYEAHFKEAANSFVYRRAGNWDWRQLDNGLPKPLGLRIPVITQADLKRGASTCPLEERSIDRRTAACDERNSRCTGKAVRGPSTR
jgi:hypothetical protein